MASLADIPDSMLHDKARDPLIAWLNTLPIPVVQKKALLHNWAVKFHVKLVAIDYKQLTPDET